MDMPVNVPIDNPNADTEWNDILRKHGVIPEKPPSPTDAIHEALAEARQQAHDSRLEGKDLDELHELEDDEDEAILEQYRKQRLAELSKLSRTSVFGQVYHLQKPDYTKDVTEASNNAFVLVHLTSSLGVNVESRVLSQLWTEIANTFGDIKFCEIRADMCIEGYPDKNTPTILVYKDGDIRKQVVTLRELGGVKTSLSDLGSLLVDVGAIKANDRRIQQQENTEADETATTIRSGKIFATNSATTVDDDDWE